MISITLCAVVPQTLYADMSTPSNKYTPSLYATILILHSITVLAQIKPSPRINRIEQLLLQLPLTTIPRQLEQINTRTRGRKSTLIITRIPNTEFGVQAPKAKQRGTRRAGHEFEYFASVVVGELLHDVPEELHGGVFLQVVADGVDAAVLSVAS